MTTKRLLLGVLALGIGSGAMAQDFFDFGQIPGLPDQPAIQIDLNPMLLGFASQATRSADPSLADLLSGLDGVRVRVYKTIDDIGDVVEYVENAAQQLERADWVQVVRIQHENEGRIYVRADENVVSGVTAMIVGEEGAVFVNVAGTIEPQQLGQLMAAVGAGEAFEPFSGFDFDIDL